ncbi:flippase [Noviherbaspirillum soli]|uniref:flippase n=1 Tax=Noviherbaspirillum soli TaxID=1064518 RepID=UPI00188B39EC|nr:flippase [Noviherbaspirillum soli]
MKTTSLKINGLMYTLKTVIALLFPLITFPYMSRTLGPDGIGLINFATAFSGYFILIAGIGIPYCGIREIAKIRNEQTELSATAQELLLMHIAASFLSLISYIVLVSFQEDLMRHHLLFMVVATAIPLAALSLDWLYQGMERYVYITIRSFVFSLVSLIALFTFVHNPEQYVECAAIGIASSLGSSVLNFWNARKIIFVVRNRPFMFRRHFKSLGKSYAILLLSNLYLNIDVLFLGFLGNTENLGYYTAASRFLTAVWALISSFGATLLPRLSYYSESGQAEEFQLVIKKSIEITVLLCIPAIAATFYLRNDIIQIFAGEKFFPAVACLSITLPGLLFASLSNIFAWQILFPKNKDNKVITSLAAAAIVSLISNYFLIAHFYHVGAAISKLFAEVVVFIMLYIHAKKCCTFSLFPWHTTKFYILATFVMLCSLAFVRMYFPSAHARLLISIPLAVLIFFSVLIVAKVEVVDIAFQSVLQKLKILKKGTA